LRIKTAAEANLDVFPLFVLPRPERNEHWLRALKG
jgi:hypothetical protein